MYSIQILKKMTKARRDAFAISKRMKDYRRNLGNAVGPTNNANVFQVKHVSESYIKPSSPLPENAKLQEFHLGGFDLAMLSVHYIQKGLLFKKPTTVSNIDQENPIEVLVQKLKHSLSVTLAHFYPLAGRLATKTQENPHSYVVYIDFINSPGARFAHSKVDLTISDILSPTYASLVVYSFFDHDRAVNHDGHMLSLLTIQVTELIDGVFIACSANHSVVDGTSYWYFLNTLSQVFMEKAAGNEISRPPVHERWFPDGYGSVFSLPFTHADQFIARHEAPKFKERIFHFSASALARLKAKANDKCKNQGVTISSLQALSALLWRCVTRIRLLPQDQITNCKLAMNYRSRLDPPLPENYFGNCFYLTSAMTTAGNLLANDFAWAALQLNKVVAEQDHKAVMQIVANWIQRPLIYQPGHFFDPCSVLIGGSPRFDMYGNEFGLGKAVAILSGYAQKFDGKITLYPGHEGGGSMDIELCLRPDFMTALECDAEFLDGLDNSSAGL